MTELVTLEISGVKCDGEDCDYSDDEVRRENYHAYVDRPCPKCGSNLLTQEDYEAVIALEGVVANFDIDIPDGLLDGEEEKHFDLNMDGTGMIEFVEREKEE